MIELTAENNNKVNSTPLFNLKPIKILNHEITNLSTNNKLKVINNPALLRTPMK